MAYQAEKKWNLVKVTDNIVPFRELLPGRMSYREGSRPESERRLRIWAETSDYFDAL